MIIDEMMQLLISHGFENVSGVVRHYNKKATSQVVKWAVTTGNFFLGNRVIKIIMLKQWKNLMARNSFYLTNGLISMIKLLSVDNFENYFVSLVSITIDSYGTWNANNLLV